MVRKLRDRTKCELYWSLTRPVVLYGYESWTIRAENANALGIPWNILRIIFGGVYEHWAWRRRMNQELAVAKAVRIRWLGHIIRMPDTWPTNKVFDGDPYFDMRRRGTQRTRWLNQVKRDLSEIACLVSVVLSGSHPRLRSDSDYC